MRGTGKEMGKQLEELCAMCGCMLKKCRIRIVLHHIMLCSNLRGATFSWFVDALAEMNRTIDSRCLLLRKLASIQNKFYILV